MHLARNKVLSLPPVKDIAKVKMCPGLFLQEQHHVYLNITFIYLDKFNLNFSGSALYDLLFSTACL